MQWLPTIRYHFEKIYEYLNLITRNLVPIM